MWLLKTTLRYALTLSNTHRQTYGTSYHLLSEIAIHLEILKEATSDGYIQKNSYTQSFNMF